MKEKVGWRSPRTEREVKELAMIWKRKQEKTESQEKTRFQSHSMINNVTGCEDGVLRFSHINSDLRRAEWSAHNQMERKVKLAESHPR